MKKTLAFLICVSFVSGMNVYGEQPAVLGTAEAYLPGETVSGGIISYEYYDENVNKTECPEINRAYLSEALPSYYKSEYVTPVKNQVVNGACWAFAAIASIETNLIKQGLADTGLDLSEAHLAYFAYNPVDDIYTDGAFSNTANAGSYAYVQGGNQTIALAALLRRNGAAYESEAPYNKYVNTALSEISEDLRYIHHAGIKNQYYGKTTDEIKSLVYKYGAAAGNYYDESGSESAYYNRSTYAYHYNGSETENHGITIIGWDDSFPKENFLTQPDSDGAWIVKNSWGTSWGDGGYEYISYETPMSAYAFEAFTDDHDNTYSYNGYISVGYSSGCKLYANSFTARKDELLKAVSVETFYPGTADIYIFKNNGTDPDSGTLLKKLSGVEIDGKYNTIELPEAIPLSEGDRFSVIFSGVNVVFESTYATCNSESGQSYIMPYTLSNFIYNGSNAKLGRKSLWTDSATGISEYNPSGASNLIWGNVAIRAFTDDMNEPEPTATPTPEPTATPTPEPTATPTPEPTAVPSMPYTPTVITDGSSVTVDYTNNYFDGESADMLIAVYSESGELTELLYRKFENTHGHIILQLQSTLTDGQYTTVHLWDDMNKMLPLSEAVTLGAIICP